LLSGAVAVTGPINLGARSLKVQGQQGALLDCQGGPCLQATCGATASICKDSSLDLSGFTVINGASPLTAGGAGGCLFAYNHDITLTDMSFSACSSYTIGGAVYVNGSTLIATNVLFDSCSAGDTYDPNLLYETSGGGAIGIAAADATLTNITANNCSSIYASGGAIAVYNSALFKLIGSNLTNCDAQYGGAISTSQSLVEMSNTEMSSCNVREGISRVDTSLRGCLLVPLMLGQVLQSPMVLMSC
jgi:hypothetical protein